MTDLVPLGETHRMTAQHKPSQSEIRLFCTCGWRSTVSTIDNLAPADLRTLIQSEISGHRSSVYS